MAQCYNWRSREGEFTRLEAQISQLTPGSTFAFGDMTYKEHFGTRYFPPAKEGFFGTTFYYSRDRDGKIADVELSLVFFGEICPASQGTLISAKGNYYIGHNTKPIDDNTNVRDVIALRPLTGGTPYLSEAFTNQMATLREIMDEDEKEANPRKYPVTGFLGSSRVGSSANHRNPLKITLDSKYRVPPDAKEAAKTAGTKTQKKNLLATNSDADDLMDVDDEIVEPEVKLHAYYPLELLPDHRGDLFEHDLAKLVQLDIRDVNGQLIPPWSMYDKLRIGTIVAVEATLICWHIFSRSGILERKVYQIHGHRLRVLSESDEPVEPRTIPILRQVASPAQQTYTLDSSSRKIPSAAFSSFQSQPSILHNMEY